MSSTDASCQLTWGDGEYRFRLPIGQIRELQDKTGAGPNVVLKRLIDGSWHVDDVREVIRLGLIGGGIEPTRAHTLVKRYVDERPLMENVQHAQAILIVALTGPLPVGDEPGKPDPAKSEMEATTDASISPASTATAH